MVRGALHKTLKKKKEFAQKVSNKTRTYHCCPGFQVGEHPNSPEDRAGRGQAITHGGGGYSVQGKI